MTIKELYKRAKELGLENAEITIDTSSDNGEESLNNFGDILIREYPNKTKEVVLFGWQNNEFNKGYMG